MIQDDFINGHVLPFQKFGDKIQTGYWSIAREIILGNCFFSNGETTACLKKVGKSPSDSERLISWVIGTTGTLIQDFSNPVWITSRVQEEFSGEKHKITYLFERSKVQNLKVMEAMTYWKVH